MNYYQTLTELVLSLPVYKITPVYSVIYSIVIPTVTAGDIISITSTFECSVNRVKYNTQISSSIIATTSATSVTGTIIDHANAWNITPAMANGVVVKARQYQFSASSSNVYINVLASASADAANVNDLLYVQQGYGHLDVIQN